MLRMNKRFNLKKAMKLNITIRAKMLCIISWLFKVKIEVPKFEWKAKSREYRKKFCEGPGEAFMKGFEEGIKKYADSK